VYYASYILRCRKLLLSDLSKWYQAVVLDNWQDPLHLEVPPRPKLPRLKLPRLKLPRHKLQRHRLHDSSSQRAEYTVSRHGARTSSPRGGITLYSSTLSPTTNGSATVMTSTIIVHAGKPEILYQAANFQVAKPSMTTKTTF